MIVPKIAEEPQKIIEHKIDQNKLASVGTDFAMLALCILAAFVSFWDVGFSINKAFAVGWLSVILYVVTVSVYKNKYDGGIYKGRQTKEYKDAHNAFDVIKDYIIGQSLVSNLAEWCNAYRTRDVEQLRKNIICPYMPYEEYLEKHLNKSRKEVKRHNLSRQARRAVFIANSIKPLELSADKLLGVSVNVTLFGKRKALPISGQEKRNRDMARNYLSKFLFTFVLGMFSIEILSDPTLETFLQWLIRMFPVVTAYVTGEQRGYRNANVIDPCRINAQSQILRLFFAESKIDLPQQGQTNEKAE